MLLGELWLGKTFNNQKKEEKSLLTAFKNMSMKHYFLQATQMIQWEIQHSTPHKSERC